MKRPADTVCPVCASVFQQPLRPQGGGKRTIYCSAKCRTKDWSRGHGASRKATILKYEAVPENKERKRERTRRATLAKYGWSKLDVERQLARQSMSCAGCLRSLNTSTARIDHCHKSGRTRGLLCDGCNWGLGHLKDNPQTLRRLMAYLDRTIDAPLIYLVGALKNPRIPHVGKALRDAGFDVMDEWFTPGEFADTNWQAYEQLRGRNYQEALRGRSATNAYSFDRSYLDMADVVVLVMPAGKSAMLELGYATGRGKLTCLFLDNADPERFDIMPNFADLVIYTENELVDSMLKWKAQQQWPPKGIVCES